MNEPTREGNQPQNIDRSGERDTQRRSPARTGDRPGVQDTPGGSQLSRRFDHGSSSAGSESSSLMPALFATLVGVGTGLAAMYFFDPDRGRRRRALLSDKLTSAGNRIPKAVRVTASDISNRAGGAWASATNLFSSDNPTNQVLEARVRSKMGRIISHPHAIRVTAQDGRITLDGLILDDELSGLLAAVEAVRGVRGVENRLHPHESPKNIQNLQGEGPAHQRELSGAIWSPRARIGAGAVGLGLGAVGATLLARSLMTGTGGRAAITIDKTINVNAPVDVLFNLWSNFENFPKFMSNVLEVTNLDDKRSHWKVAGPAGVPVEWDAEITKIVPNEMIVWRSVEGSTVENAGYVLFEPNEDGTTEVNVRLNYDPPAGAIGHAVAKAFGADPKTEMDEDLMRMKSLLETGRLPHDAAQTPINTDRANRVH